ncbi:hypothetical protein HMI56_000807 [Coelomomyces lativittatus]|nr:hypothetical protein HMI56_000807 [Coelomomyces lativittatus]
MTPSNMLSTNGFQRQIRSEASVDGLRTFWDQWVHGSGVPKIEFTYSQNNGRQVIEFDMVQSNTSIRGRSAGIQSGVFTGAISISVYEIDGVIYTHNLDVARTTQHFEVRFNSRYKYKKMLGKSTVGAAKEEEEEEWLNTVKDDNMFEQHRWIQWVWVDPDAEWPCPVILKQPDFKWARLVQHAPSVLCQFDAVSHLRNYPSLQCAQLLFKLASDPKVFHRIRSDAVNSMVACAIPELDWIGFEYLLQLLQRYTVPCSSELLDVVPSSSNWQNFQEFFVFKSVFSAFSLIKNEFGNSPYQVKRLILNAIKYNDATRLGSISESEYLSFLIKCLCQVMLIIPLPFQRNRNSKLKASHSMTTSNRFSEPKDLKPTETVQPVGPKVNSEELDLGFDFLSDNLSDGEKSGHKESKNEKESVESKDPSSNNSTSSPSLENVGKFKLSFSTMPLVLEEALESIERVRIMELMTSCGKDITIACLSCLCQWMMANLIDLELDLFLEYSGPSFSSEIRLAAVQCLFLLQAYENDFVTKYLFQLIQENDPSPVLQREIPHYFLAIARLSGAQDKGTLKGKRLVNFEKFKEFTLKWLPELTSILLNTHITNYIVHDIMDWIDLMLSPPLIRVKVKWSTFNQPPPPLSTTTVINNLSTSKPASKSWHPSYKGIPPTKRLGQTNASLMNAGISVTECLKFHSSAGPFLSPVPPNVVGYYDIIKDPMDLSCIERKLKNGHYATLTALFEDVEKIFLNCYLFNSETSEIYKQSKTLETYFREQVQPYAEKMIPPPRPIEMTEAEWHKMRKVLRKIRERSSAIPFSKPVKNVPRYYDHITHPIDLGTIRKKVDNKEYPTLGSFESDMKLMFSNCFSFNNPGDETYRMGRELYDIFLKEWNAEFPVSLKLKPVLDTTHHGEQDTHLTELGITAVNGKLQPFGEELINIEDEGIPSHSSASSLFKSASSATSTSHFRVEKNQPEMDLDKDPASTRINLLRRTSLQSTDNFMDSVVISVPQKESQPVIYQSTPRKRSFANDSKGGSKSGVTPKKIRFQGLGEKAKSPTLTLSRSVGNGEGFLDTNDLNDKLKRFTIVHQLLIIHPESFDFRIPVDPIALNVPTYLQIIKNPMDLQTIGTRLAHYASHMDFFLDVILMLKNAITFNQKDSPVYISAHLFYKYVQSLWRKHFQMTEFPTLLPHPIEKRSVKKQTSASSSSSTSNASSSKPSSAPTVTISFSKLTMTAGTSVPPSNSTFKEATAPECNSNSENTSPKEDFNSSLSSRSNSKSSLKISLPSLVPETSLSVDTSSISTQKEQKKNPSSPTSPSTPTTPSLITQNTQNTSSVTSLAPSSPSHSHPQPLFSPELFSLEMTPERLAVCNQAFQKAFTSKYAAPFLRPVDPELDGVPQYFDIIQTPMDFGTIHGRLSTSSYTTVGAFIEDVLLVFKNCSDFNGVEHPYTKQCKLLRHPLAYELRTVLPLLNVAMDMSKASRLLEKLKEHKAAYPFLVPVDAVLLQIPNYYEVIDYPIDFQTITKKLTEGQYTHFYQFFNDVRFIFYNCYKFNPQGHFVYKEGKELQKYFENECRKFKLASFLKLPHPLV